MNRLWAPWRKAYLRPSGKKEKGCLFCRMLAQHQDRKNYIFNRSLFSFGVLNKYPYNNGHVMVVPMRHVDSLAALKDREKIDLLDLLDKTLEALKKKMRPQGFNIGINMGRMAGAGVRGHIHIHIVPRWGGDSNFMPVVGETKVISESLTSVYQNLALVFRAYGKKESLRRKRPSS